MVKSEELLVEELKCVVTEVESRKRKRKESSETYETHKSAGRLNLKNCDYYIGVQ